MKRNEQCPDERTPFGKRCRGEGERGGSWNGDGLHCRSADREWITPGHRYGFLGFRLSLRPE